MSLNLRERSAPVTTSDAPSQPKPQIGHENQLLIGISLAYALT